MYSDDELYRSYLSGDISAFDALITKYTGRLVLYLGGLTHNMHDAEDLAIDTFAALMTRKPDIREGGFQAYLYRAARNRATNFHMLRRRLPTFSLVDALAREALAACPEDEFLRDERRQAVRRCLNRIDGEPREALWLIYFEGLSYSQTAAVLGVSVKKIDNLLAKGKRLMRQELRREGFGDADE